MGNDPSLEHLFYLLQNPSFLLRGVSVWSNIYRACTRYQWDVMVLTSYRGKLDWFLKQVAVKLH